MNTQSVKHTTPGPWIVTTELGTINTNFNKLNVISVKAINLDLPIAITGVEGAPDEAESIANAALIAIAPDMLDALIAIQDAANSRDGVDNEAVNTLISDIFAKLANEAGES